METARKILLEALNNKDNRSDLIHILTSCDVKNPKSAEASAEARKKGNDLLLKHQSHNAETHKDIFSHYCESIALAPMESRELAMAYGNRSYLLLHMHKYEECIQDIDRALEIAIPDFLKAKLLCRKAECRKRLGSSSTSEILKMAQDVAETVDDQDRIKISKMIDAVNALDVGTKKQGMSKSDQKRKADNNLAVTDDFSSRVSIKYSEKHGRHLVAAKDYQPGDIIFVEKIHAATFDKGSSLLGCDYCQRHVWSSIPCNYCSWAMYCSENCKKEAWNEYHDIDCLLIFHLKNLSSMAWKPWTLAIRILIMAIKETGSIANLKNETERILADHPRESFQSGKFGMKSIRHVFSLASNMTPYDVFVELAMVAPHILISLTKYSKLKDDFNVKKVEDLEMNEDILFLGSLLIKLMAVLNVNAFGVSHNNFVPITSAHQDQHSMFNHFDKKRCLGTVCTLMNHSCFPSAKCCGTESNKVVVYALQPIKKHSQIFVQYQYGFENEHQSVRQAKFTQKYNFTCECRACVEDWPPIVKLTKDVDDEELEADVLKDLTTGKISHKDLACSEIVKARKEGRQVDKLYIKKLSALITRGMNWNQPSHMFCSLTGILKDIFESTYSPKPLVFNGCD